MTPSALSNAVAAIDTRSQFMRDLAQRTTNDGTGEGAAIWLIGQVQKFLADEGQPSGPISAFDFAIHDIEALIDVWPVFHRAWFAWRDQGLLAGCESPLPDLARYLVDRLPGVWRGVRFIRFPPATNAVRIADRVDTLVGMFAIGRRPTGSKDPLAMRRAAREVLQAIVCPCTVGRLT